MHIPLIGEISSPFAKLTPEQFGTWALINIAALAAIAYTRRPEVIGAGLGAIVGSFGAAWERGCEGRSQQNPNDGSCSTIIFRAIIGAGFGLLVEKTTYPSYLADLASDEPIVTRVW